jgi:hypothetical protein
MAPNIDNVNLIKKKNLKRLIHSIHANNGGELPFDEFRNTTENA